MSVQVTAKRNSTTSLNSTWELTFPVDIHIEKESSILVHRFIKCTSAFILDKRGLLKGECFKTRSIEKLQIPIFKKGDETSDRLIKKLDALKEAIQKKYLREFAIVFYEKPDEENIIEVFSFRLVYGEGGKIALSVDSGMGSQEFDQNLVKATFGDLGSTKKEFVDTIKNLHRSIKNLVSLQDRGDGEGEADASFRISFTEDAPKDFMPEGFDESPKFYELDAETVRGQIGVICGGHHKIQVLAASRKWKSGRFDLNQTISSLNQSTCAPPARSQPNKNTEKKMARVEKRSPYGKSMKLTKKIRAEQDQA